MDDITAIRREHGLDICVNNAEARSAIDNLRGNLERALMSEELYSKPTHFLLELIQNADDNQYIQGIDPTLTIKLLTLERVLIVECNEVGFTERNVRAICSIGKSTKKGQAGYIGEKGIGFKSVFKIADVVYVLSNIYRFKFDKRTELGMIAPIWTNEYNARSGWTTVRLHLSPSVNLQELQKNLSDIEASLLLFLRKLRKIELTIGKDPQTYSRHDEEHGIIRLDHPQGGSKQYLMIKHSVGSMPEEKKREAVANSEVVLGFPLNADHSPMINNQEVHAFLPVRSYGFKFLIQADFLLAANREDILPDLAWNRALRDAIAPAFCASIAQLRSIPALKYQWLRYIPGTISDSFMKPIKSGVLQQLRTMEIIDCRDGVSRKGSSVVVCSSEYADSNDEPLIPERFLPSRLHYLSSAYGPFRVLSTLKDLGVKDMNSDTLVSGLQQMVASRAVQLQPEDWLESICAALLGIVKGKQGKPYIVKLKKLAIVPLTDGTWVSPSVENLFFDASLDDVPVDLGIRLVRRMPTTSAHYRLLTQLGIKNADKKQVISRIVELHQHSQFDREHAMYAPAHAKFVFRHRSTIKSSVLTLRVLTRNGSTTLGQRAYLNHPRHKDLRLDKVLPLLSPFLDDSYYQEQPGASISIWLDWIHTCLGVSIAPRITSGSLSPEFSAFLNSADTASTLRVLKEYWSDLENTQKILLDSMALKALRGLMVDASDGKKHRFDATFIDISLSSRFPELPFLPLEKSTDPAWGFLRHLGVTSQPDGMLYLKRLVMLSGRVGAEVSRQDVEECYKQLDVRFNDNNNGKAIREAFNSHALVFIPAVSPGRRPPIQGGEWISLSNTVWSGPRCMRSKVTLKSIYPHFETFWRHKIQLSHCPDDILLQEFRNMASEWRGKFLNDDAHLQVYALLNETAGLVDIEHAPHYGHNRYRPQGLHQPPGWLPSLRNESIFPVRDASNRIVLSKLGENFYVPDESGELEAIFKDDVRLLHLPPQKPIRDLWPLLHSEWFRELKSLKEYVKENAETHGEKIPNISLSSKYVARVPFLRRLLLASVRSTSLSSVITSTIAKLEDIGFYYVDVILYTYSLDGIKRSKKEEVAINETDTRFVVYVSKTCTSGILDIALCSRLARVLSLDHRELLPVLTLPLSSLNVYMQSQGIYDRDIEAEDGEPDTLWLQQLTQAHHGSSSNGLTDAQLRSAQTSPKSQKRQRQRSTVLQDFDNLLSRNASQIKSTVLSQSLVVNPSNMNSLATCFNNMSISSGTGPIDHSLVGIGRTNGKKSARGGRERSNVTQPGPEEEMHGILGEFYVYQLFQKELPGFEVDNWTSELRARVPGFTPYHGTSYTDLTYEDYEWHLTGRIFGPETTLKWQEQGQWPTYHLEVKTTSTSKGSPFHVSAYQLDIASRMTIRDMNIAPENIFVLIRVASILSGPTHEIISDLHRALYEGRVKLVADVEMAT